MKESFEIIWSRIVENQGKTFLTITKKEFTYKVENNIFKPLRPKKAPDVAKDIVEQAYNVWPIAGPAYFPKNILAPSYLWGVLNDERIVHKQ